MVLQSKTNRNWLYLLVFVSLLLGSLPAHALQDTQNEGAANIAEQDVEPSDPYGRDTPRGSFTGFQAAAEEFDFEKAAEYLDLRNLPTNVSRMDGATLAEQLDFVIKRNLQVDSLMLSGQPEGQPIDDLPDYRDELGRIKTIDGDVVLLLQKVPGPEEGFVWKISNATVADIPKLFKEFSYPPWVEVVRSKLPEDKHFLGLELFKWVIVLVFIILAIPVGWLIATGLSRLLTKPQSPLHDEVRKLLTRPVLVLGILLLAKSLLHNLGLGATAQKFQQAGTIVTIIFVWFLFSVIDLARARRRERYLAQGRTDAAVLGRPMANALKLFIVFAAFLVWLTNAGVDITTLLAGLGIGGVAIALALQKPIEDLLGAISIYSQQPVVTGDLCKVGSVFGQVEEIGLRTTRIRTLSETRVSIPNSKIAYGEIENYSVRKKMLYHPDLPLRCDTTPEQMQAVTSGIAAMLKDEKDIIQEYLVARAILDGIDPYLSQQELAKRFLDQTTNFLPHPTPHPPVLALLFLPLGLMNYKNMAIGWYLFEIICFIVAVYVLLKLLDGLLGIRHKILIYLIALSWSPFQDELAYGQLMILMLILLISAWQALCLNNNIKGGVLIGCSVAIKLITWPFVIFLAIRKNWEALIAAGVTIIIAHMGVALLMGIDRIVYYYSKVVAIVPPFYQAYDGNFSMWTVGWKLFEGLIRHLGY